MPALLLLSALLAGSFSDTAVIPSFQKLNPRVAHFRTLARLAVDSHQDLLLVWASPRDPDAAGVAHRLWWGKDEILGLFLQDRDPARRVYQLALLPGEDPGSAVEVARLTPSELLLFRLPEQGPRPPNVKLFFDVRSKRLLRRVDYRPFSVVYIREQGGVPYFIAGDAKQFLVIRPEPAGGFQILPESAAQPLLAGLPVYEYWVGREKPETFRAIEWWPLEPVRFGPAGRFVLREDPQTNHRRIVEHVDGRSRDHELPQSNPDQWAAVRPQIVQGRARLEQSHIKIDQSQIKEEIGPHQATEGRLWLGKTFYDAEGETGIGGFGYFDPDERKFTVFSPPEIYDWSVSALRVEPEAVWLALVHRGEYGDSSGGLLRWDRASHDVRRYELPWIAHAVTRYAGRLYLATDDGIAVLVNDRIERYIIDVTLRGTHEIVPQ